MRRKKDYIKIYNNYMCSSIEYEEYESKRLNDFIKMYSEKIKDDNFNPTLEKNKLITRINSNTDNVLGIYVSISISALMFLVSTLISFCNKDIATIMLSIGIALILISVGGYIAYKMMKNMDVTDALNTALLALDIVEKRTNKI